jgi:hypothetical protein
MGQIVNGLDVVGVGPSGSFTKVVIKARLSYFFIGKEMKMKKM